MVTSILLDNELSAISGRMPGRSSSDVELRPVAADRRAVDQHVPHAGRLLGGEAFGVGREVAHALRGPGAHRLRIEDAHIGPVALAQVAAAHEAEHVGRLAGELAHRVLERHQLPLAHPCAEQVGGQRRVAQLVDVRAGVGEAERHVLVREQVPDRLDVVVGDVGAKARREILGDRQLAHHVERAAAALARELAHPPALQLREPLRLGDLERLPARLHRRLLQVGRGARLATSGSRYAAMRASRSPCSSSPKTVAGVEAVRVGQS